ncbi:MAG: peptidase S24 [Candidatus Brocadia sp. WS118]|nr:MAG: peptidase S24 [Candidatus Brocadia sp. WS118]
MNGIILGQFKGLSDIPGLEIPYYITRVSAGFPSPADDHIQKKLDLNELVIKHPAATFFVRVNGDSMKNAGIFHDDILVVDRALDPKSNDIIVCVLNGEFAVKRFVKDKRRIVLYPENPDYMPIEVTEEMEFQVWGVVPYVIHKT